MGSIFIMFHIFANALCKSNDSFLSLFSSFLALYGFYCLSYGLKVIVVLTLFFAQKTMINEYYHMRVTRITTKFVDATWFLFTIKFNRKSLWG